MVGEWRAVATGSVREDVLRSLLIDMGTPWEECAHLTATVSLGRAARASGSIALPIPTLMDLVVLPGLPDDLALPIDAFPTPDVMRSRGAGGYQEAVVRWQQAASGRRLRLGLAFDDQLRAYVRDHVEDPALARVLVASRRELSRTVHTLTAAGLRPEDISPSDVLGRHAVRAWAHIETAVPGLTQAREDLWIDWADLEEQSTAHAKGLRRRVDAALAHCFGSVGGRRVVVHHGFYFFTPPQWAFFQLLRRTPGVKQIFVVHDDGSNRAFESWRRFFIEEWDMPRPESVGGIQGVNSAAASFRDALNGLPVDAHRLGDDVRILDCRSPTELVREWRREAATAGEAGMTPRRYAADARGVERFVRRLGRETGDDGTDLAQLPVGSFLLAVHDCIYAQPGQQPAVRLGAEALLDMVSSGYLDPAGVRKPPSAYVPALRRALPFFRGCTDASEWRQRAGSLQDVIGQVAALGERDPTDSDVERLQRAASNPLRLAPWADLTREEAGAIEGIVATAVELVAEITAQERVLLGAHVRFLREKLRRGMQDLPQRERDVITAKVEGFSVGLDDDIDVEGLVDVVHMLLGRTVQFDLTGEDEDTGTSVTALRGLDALGLRRLAAPLHLANLADGVYPGRSAAIGWPFRLEDLRGEEASVHPITVGLLETRAETAALGDLYLMWLALDGVEPGQLITLSWISELAGEPKNPSSIVSLLAQPTGRSEAIRERAGGVAVATAAPRAELPALRDWRPPEPSDASDGDVAAAVAQLDPRAAASSVACSRRFALQWAVGPSAAFQADHHHAMLYGNVAAALIRDGLLQEEDAFQLCDQLWQQLTAGERASSLAKSAVMDSADPAWILTLAGSRGGSGRIDSAYHRARDRRPPIPHVVAPPSATFLPGGPNDAGVCKECPVRPRCAVWIEEER